MPAPINRRTFIRNTAAAAAAALPAGATRAGPAVRKPAGAAPAKIAAYYFRAHMYTCVPRHIRDDMEWMAGRGTDYVCPAVLEQDLFSAQENLNIITEEAERAGMRVIAVPSRWAGLTAGAPKVPSLYSSMNPQSLMLSEDGDVGVNPKASGVISSIHAPDTMEFFLRTLSLMYKQHPSWAGMIIDEPKAFRMDYSPMAIRALGENAPVEAHYRAFADFLSNVCAFAKEKWPDKYNIMFQKADCHEDELDISSGVMPLDYFGADGRPWGLEDDREMDATGKGQKGGDGKVLLSGIGEKFIGLARREPGRKSFLLLENHNLQASMMDALDRNYPAVLRLPADMFCYYYYPRNVDEPDRAMEIIGHHLKNFIRGRI